MTDEYLFDLDGATVSDVLDQLIRSEDRIPGLVFTYPPISLWAPDDDTSPERIWAGSDVFSHNLYIHIPFCKQKCSFCYYSVAVVQDDTEVIWEYLRCLEIEARRYAPQLAGRAIETVFVGGGTPSRLNPDQVDFLFERVIGQFDLSTCREITYECSPDSATKDRIEAMVRNGTTRLSMGVQSLDPEILRLSRRSDTPDSVVRTYDNMVESGVKEVNIDLIAGIEREALDNMRRTMDAVQVLDPVPTQITLFTLSVRRGSINDKTFREDNLLDVFRRSLALFRFAKRRMLAAGYEQYSRNLFPRPGSVFHYQDNHWGNNGYVLALGASGYSHSHGFTYQNPFKYTEYMRRVREGEPIVERAFPLSEEESLRRHMSLAMKHGEIDVARFNSFYPAGSEPLARFGRELEALEALGVVDVAPDRIAYRSDYLDVADRFVRLFYSDSVSSAVRSGLGQVIGRTGNAFNFTV
ncbi:coproporphyrinogen-III oxidase family protein [Cellulosimicrobium protaetiae]|uniref:Heme chaperone HemW n=1 Tax=Cellulosimicrobium protaetiae TaxID=2587808 RepID=A0A6M5U8J9_9MICO|nr:radical SAM protein [Cellulosimicrobium protaetiae]QJW34847.1 radical SAM protein [Cellulosimicrobium protaetiae]